MFVVDIQDSTILSEVNPEIASIATKRFGYLASRELLSENVRCHIKIS